MLLYLLFFSLSLFLMHMKFFPYILLFVAMLVYVPALFWRFTVTPGLSSDLTFIMNELDQSYNRAIKLAKHLYGNSTSSDTHRYACCTYCTGTHHTPAHSSFKSRTFLFQLQGDLTACFECFIGDYEFELFSSADLKNRFIL